VNVNRYWTRVVIFAGFSVISAAIGLFMTWIEGFGFNPGNATTWAIALFTGLICGSLSERKWATLEKGKGVNEKFLSGSRRPYP
jgi:H+/Cl- antiporter ClcA